MLFIGHIWIDWDYGNICRYRYGAEGCYDVVTSEDVRLLSEDQLIAVGCVVRRGNNTMNIAYYLTLTLKDIFEGAT